MLMTLCFNTLFSAYLVVEGDVCKLEDMKASKNIYCWPYSVQTLHRTTHDFKINAAVQHMNSMRLRQMDEALLRVRSRSSGWSYGGAF